MTVKSIVDIDVNDQAFQKFAALFEKYQTALDKTPSAWAKVNKEQAASASMFNKVLAAQLAQNQAAKDVAEEEKRRLQNLTVSERLWMSISRNSTTFARNITGATASLLRWTGLFSAVSGLVGLGGLWGIDRMASSVGDQRRSATGLGLSIGQQKSFEANFGRYVDTGSFLSGINTAINDYSKQGALYGLGVNPNGSTSDVALAVLDSLRQKAIAAKGQPGALGSIEQIYKTGDFGIGIETLKRLQGASDSEYQRIRGSYLANVSGANINDATAERWQSFSTKLDLAGQKIFKVFVDGLTPLAAPLGKLSDSLVHLLQVALKKDGPLEKGVVTIAGWIDQFATAIDKPDFLKAIDTFTDDISKVGTVLHGMAEAIVDPVGTVERGAIDAGTSAFNWLKGSLIGLAQAPALANADKNYGLPAGLLENVLHAESGGHLGAVSRAGAIGPFQFMPDTARQYGVNPTDFDSSLRGTGAYLRDLERKYQGDLSKALAAYNDGPGNVDKLIRTYGKTWLAHAPQETQDYVKKTTAGINVVVTNNTGGSSVVAVSQLQ